eukprot:Colp12_sorted_trinity150504_noHs@34395
MEYTHKAGGFLSRGILAEGSHHYQEAIDLYEQGIATLLEGAKGDHNQQRRDAVKAKVTSFLSRLESIQNVRKSGQPRQATKHFARLKNPFHVIMMTLCHSSVQPHKRQRTMQRRLKKRLLQFNERLSLKSLHFLTTPTKC